MFDQQNRGKIKNAKLLAWRLEISQLTYTVYHRQGREHVVPDAMSICSTMPSTANIRALHEQLGHLGFSHLYHFVRSRNLPDTSDETKNAKQFCRTCAEVKPRFFKPAPGTLIKATRPWERVSIDFKGPVQGPKPYLFVSIDECSRFPFVFACSSMTTKPS